VLNVAELLEVIEPLLYHMEITQARSDLVLVHGERNELVVTTGEFRYLLADSHEGTKIGIDALHRNLIVFVDVLSDLAEDVLGLVDRLLAHTRDGERLGVQAELIHRLLVHRDVCDFLEQLSHILLQIGLGALLEVEWREVVLVNDCGVVDFGEGVLLLDSFEAVQVGEVIPRLRLEDLAELLLGFLDVVERSSLVHPCLTNPAPSRKHHVEVSYRVVEQLHLVEDIISVDTVPEVNLREVGIPRLLAFAVNAIGLLEVASLVNRNELLHLVLILHCFLLLLLGGLHEEGGVFLEVNF